MEVMNREASLESRSGEPSLLADQTTVYFIDKLLYQIEKVKPPFSCRKPAAKVELGESKVLFWVGSHGDFKEEKEVRFSCEDGKGLKKRRRENRRQKRDMVSFLLVNGDVNCEEGKLKLCKVF